MRQPRSLPLPRTWLNRPVPESDTNARPDRETLLAGRGQTPGTKAHLRHTLLDAGWDVEAVEAVSSGKFVARHGLYDLLADKEPDFNAIRLQLKDKGFNVSIIEKEAKESKALTEQGDSFTRFPWWLSAQRGQRQILLMGRTQSLTQRATASFYRDIWANLGAAPAHRMPHIQRISLLSFMSAEGVTRFGEKLAPNTDIVFMYGLDVRDEVYRAMGYAEAIARVAPHALVVYECVPAPDLDTGTLVSAAMRSGFHFIWGVTRG